MILLAVSSTVFAQYNTDGLGTPIEGVKQIEYENKTPNTDSLTTNLNDNLQTEAGIFDPIPIGDVDYVGSTKGVFNVSLMGEATYNLPIEVPPGINGVIPNIGISFNSQAGNGIAGYGWSISGISSINKVGSNKFFDGKNTTINYSADDRFMLDGQRLLPKSGVYGGNGAEYQMETYSNLKITSHGNSLSNNGPEYFKVQYPDGNIAYYGRSYTTLFGIGSATRTNTVYALTYITNPQNVVIKYSYINDNGNLLISKISYGYRDTNPLSSARIINTENIISFTYKDRRRAESGFTYNEELRLTKIIDKITIKGYAENYRTYQLTYKISTLGYEQLQKITETSGDGTISKKPVTFTYGTDTTTKDLITEEVFEAKDKDGGGFSGLSSKNTKLFPGNFSGQGRVGFLMHFTSTSGLHLADGKKLFIYNPSNPNNPNEPIIITQNFTNNPFNAVVPTKRLTADNVMLPNDGWTTITETSVTQNTTTYRFNSYIYMPSTTNSIFPIGTVKTVTMDGDKNIYRQFLSGDFNGDGISEIVRVPNVAYYYTPNIVTAPQTIEVYDINTGAVSVLNNVLTGFDYHVTDIDGDGYDEFVILRNAHLVIYKYNQETKQLYLYKDQTTPNIKSTLPVFTGDFNGDGKLDFVTPKDNGSLEWYFYINKDNGEFASFSKNIGIKYEADGEMYENDYYNRYHSFNYIFTDFNNDGKTDLIKTYDNCRVDRSNASEIPQQNTLSWVFENLGVDVQSQNVSFSIPSTFQELGTPANRFPLIAYTNYQKNTYKSELSLITGDKIKIFKSKKDNVLTQQLKSINEYDIKTNITYDVYDEKKTHFDPTPEKSDVEDAVVPFVSFGENLPTYPKVEMDVIPGFYLVKKVTYDSSNRPTLFFGLGEKPKIRKKLFSYGDAMVSYNGKGFLGFKGTMSTNVYIGGPTINDLQDQVKTINIYDLDNNRLVKEEIVAHDTDWANFYSPPVNFISKKNNTYQITNLASKVFKAVNILSVAEDGLTGVQRTITSTYDNYSNPLSITETVVGGGDTSTLNTVHTYQNSIVNDNYYIGRPVSKTVKINGIQNSKETYVYDKNLLTNITKTATVGSAPLLEENVYDIFGNIIQKTIFPANLAPRGTSYVYDGSGRYVEKSIDIEGLETNYTYNKNKGWLLSETDAYGLTNSNGYNAFGIPVSQTDYLGNTTTHKYETRSPNLITESFVREETTYPDGRKERSVTDAWGNKISDGHTDIEGNWVNRTFSYDSQNRLIKQSEPYIINASQFTTFVYDEYGRLIKTSMPNGKEITTSYDGLSTTVDDGIRTKTETKNINNQTKKIVDNGETINYSYNTNGTLLSTNYAGTVTSFEYDEWGRKTKVSDPSAGTYTYEYNSLGDLIKEVGPNGTITNTYDATGKLTSTSFPGNVINYYYDDINKLLSSIETTTSDGTYYQTIYYDNYSRLKLKQYASPLGVHYTYIYDFDNLGRGLTEEKGVSGAVSYKAIKTKNVYKNGYLWKLQDAVTNEDLKVYNSFNERGLATNITLGNGLSTEYTFDQFGFLTQNNIVKNNSQLFTFNNTWDVERGNLTSRTNSLFTNGISENFQYDSFDRITSTQTKQGNSIIASEALSYDGKGRILNSNVGNYSYDSSKSYQLQKIDNLNDLAYYQDNPLQQVTYNAKKAPLTIKQQGKENIYFKYDGFNNRTAMYYGNEATSATESSKVRYYSPEGDIEVDFDKTTNKYIINLYADGDAYYSNIVQRTENGTTANFYLHRDYLGSILAITNATGNVVEKRHFDAWGNILLVQDGQNNNLEKLTFLERGYTGHEHLQGVGLINMNARLYDAKIHRFLAPDNFIQDPNNSQSFNRYGYAWNNPLKFSDANGEFLWCAVIAGAIIGATMGAASYASQAIQTGTWNWGKFGLSVFSGALVGAVSGAVAPVATVATSLADAAIGGFVAGFMPSYTIPVGDWSFSISPAIAFGNSAGVGINISAGYDDGNFSIAGGIGVMKYGSYNGFGKNSIEVRKSILLAYDSSTNGIGISFGTNFWSGDYKQRTGMLGLRGWGGSITYENDGSPFDKKPLLGGILGDGHDRYRTAAMTLSYKDFSAGFNLFTGERTSDSYYEKGGADYDTMTQMKMGQILGFGDANGGYGAKLRYGLVEEKGPRYRLGAAYIGWKNYRIGINSDRYIRHSIQNIVAHTWISPQPGFEVLSGGIAPYFQYQTRNNFTSW